MTEALEPSPLMVPMRSIPVPTSISAEAGAVLGHAGAAPIAWPDHPAADDLAGWLAFIATSDANMAAMVATVEQDHGTDVATIPIGAMHCYLARPKGAAERPERILFEVHGGALICGGGALCRAMAVRAASVFQAVVYSADYRMPPVYPYPAPLDDCFAAYRHLVDRFDPACIVVHGSSAGGNLAAAVMLRAVAEGLPLPAGLILETPELDLTESGDSFQTNMFIDTVLQRGLMPVNRLYAAGHDLADPMLSPLFGDFSRGFPPTLLTAGTRDLFLSNAVRMLHRLRQERIPTELLVYEAMPHGGFFGTPDDRVVEQDLRQFADRCWNGNLYV